MRWKWGNRLSEIACIGYAVRYSAAGGVAPRYYPRNARRLTPSHLVVVVAGTRCAARSVIVDVTTPIIVIICTV